SDTGLPDLAIGRLSVRTTAQADTMVQKIVSYGVAPASAPWTKNILLVADENDAAWSFEAASAALQAYLPAGYHARRVFRGQLGLDAARASLPTAVNAGQLIVDYHGHGSVQIWGGDGELLTNEDVYGSWQNIGQLPFVVAMDCLNGLFQGIWDEES